MVEQEVPLDGHGTVVGDRAGIRVEIASVEVVGGEEVVVVVPHDLRRELGVGRLEVRKGQPRDVVLQREAVGAEAYLLRILLRCLLVRLRPDDAAGLDDGEREPVPDAPLETRRYQILHPLDVLGRDPIAGSDVGGGGGRENDDGDERARDAECGLHDGPRTRPQLAAERNRLLARCSPAQPG